MIPAPRNNPDFNSHEWQDWFFQVWKTVGGGSSGGNVMPSTTKIENKWSVAGFIPDSIYYQTGGQKSTLCGSLVSGVEKNIFSISGKGTVQYLAIHMTAGATRTLTIRLNIDGVDVFLFTSGAGAWVSGSGNYINLVGLSAQTSTSNIVVFPIYFNTSLDLYVTSTVTDTDAITTYSIYTLNT